MSEKASSAAASAETQPPARPWAVRSSTNPHGESALSAHLARRGLTGTREFEPYDDDRLNRELCAGRYEGVVFADLDSVLQGIWRGHARIDQWLSTGVHIEVADSTLSPQDLESLIGQVYHSYIQEQRAHRTRQVAAAVVLCLMAIAAMALMVWLIPPTR